MKLTANSIKRRAFLAASNAMMELRELGDKAANMHKAKRENKITGRGAVGKTAIHGVLQRGTFELWDSRILPCFREFTKL